ncbi:GAF and ANTAR domain-containing protein [Nakamurella flavida]|uniref:GAF and ANTAR domain-containing protein n=1 Tax=Nakamurella flavida TaxID=363630 RepID=A0A938YMH7_9ACTN|nr:GAF and ANTAR domain-containing protein [Nakamurella flavida]MBM9477969.1 GAF and ANTAR domain-containing protein [Nakamurella flavida]MDP9778315.1 hypothetical protein [Nakamurella flavida]
MTEPESAGANISPDAVRRALDALPQDASRLVQELARQVDSEAALIEIMQRASAEAVRLIADVSWAGVTAHVDGVPFTAAHTDARMLVIDEGQYHEGDGPCLRAMRTGQTIWMSLDDVRQVWADLAEVADRIGVRAFRAEPLHARDTAVGALNLYSERDGGLRQPDMAVLTVLRHFLDRGFTEYSARQPGEDQAVLIREAARARVVIGRATGVLMALRGLDQDTAREELTRLAAEQDVDVVIAAQDVIDRHLPPRDRDSR